MAYNKRTWLGRQGTGLNKFSIGGATPVTIVNQPDSVTQVGDALSAGNLNDLEDRIEDAFGDVDTALDTKADEQDVTNLNDAIAQHEARIENLEEAHGSYHEVDVKSVYTIPTGKGSNWIVDGLRGVSRADNQIMRDWNFADITNWSEFGNASFSVTSNVCKVTATASGSQGMNYAMSFVNGHKYLVALDVKAETSGHQFGVGLDVATLSNNIAIPIAEMPTSWTRVAGICSLVSSANDGFHIAITSQSSMSAGDFFSMRNVMVRDLTLYFNGSIPSDADTIAKIQTSYPWLLTPSDYGTSGVNTVYEGIKSKARNLWDEVWEVGSIDSSGQPITANDQIRSKNYTAVRPNTAYYFYIPSTWLEGYWYDADKNFISRFATDASPFGLRTSPSNAFYCKFRTSTTYGNTYHDNICINISDSDNGTYTPYKPPVTLTFPTPVSLKSAGSVAEEAYLNEEGEAWKTNPLRTITFNNDTYWQRSNDGVYFTTDVSGLYNESVVPFCPPYIGVSNASGNTDAYSKGNMTCCFRRTTRDRFYIRDDYAFVTMDYSASQFKEYIAGKPLTFALATPDADTPLTVLTDNLISTEAGGTIESILTNPVDDSMTLGYINL